MPFHFCGTLALAFCCVFALEFGTLSFELRCAFAFYRAFLLAALPFHFCRALALAFCGQLALAFCGALPGLLCGAFPLLPLTFLPRGAFLLPPGSALALRGVPVTFRGAVVPQGVIRPGSAVRRCAAVRPRIAIWLLPGDAVGLGNRNGPRRGQARYR